MGKRIKLECHKIENGGRIWGRECLSPGYECSQSALQYDDLCRAMNTAMSADLQKNVYQPKIGEVYVAEISSKKMRCRVEVLHILQGSVVHCLLVDFGVKELINVTSLTAIPAHWLSVPCQSQCYILDNLQPVTLATNTEDMITSLQPCRNWGQSASVFVANFIKDSTLIEAEILCTNNNFHHAKVYGLQLGVMLCLNDLLVEEQYAVPLIKTGIEVGTDERQSQPDLITDTGLTHPNVKSVAQSLTNQSSLPDIMCGSNVHSSMHTNQSHLTEKKSQPVNPTDVMCTVAISPSRVASVATNSPVTSPMSTNNSIDHTTDSEYDTSTTSHSNSITFDGPTEPALSKIPLKPRGIFALIRPKVPDPPKSNRFSSRISMLGASTTPIVAPTPESAKVSSLVNITSPRTHAMEPEVMAPNMSTVLTTSGKGSTCMSPPMPGPIEPTIRFGMQSPTEPRSAARPSSYRFAEPKSSVLQTGENKSSMMKPTAPVMPCHNDPIRTATVTRPDMPCFTIPTHKPVMFPPTVTTRAPLRPAGVRHGLRPPSSRLKLKSASFPTSRDSSTSRPPPVVKTTPQRNNYTFAGLSDSSEDSCGYPTMMPKLLHSTNSQVSAIKQINESLSSDGRSSNVTNPSAQTHKEIVDQCSMSTKNSAVECSLKMPALCSMSESDIASDCSPNMPALCSMSESDKASECSPKMPGLFSMSGSDKASECSPKMPGLFSMSGSDKASDYSPKMPALCSQSESDSTHEYKPPALKQKTSFDMQIPASELSMDPSYNISHPDGDSDALNPSDILSGDSVNITNPTAQLPDRETVAQCSMSTKNTALECSPKMPGLCSMSESDKSSDYSPKMPALCSQSESDSTHEYKPSVLKQKTSFDMQMSASNLSKDASYNIPSLDGDFGDSGTLNPLDKLCEDSHNSAHNLISSPTPEKSVGNVTLKTAEATKTSIDDRTLELVNLVDSCVLDRWKEELEQLSSAEQETQQNGVGSNFAATDIRETKDPGTSVNPIDLIKEAHEKGILALNNTGELLKPGSLSRKEMKDIFTAMQQVRNDSNVLISASLKLKTIYHIADTNFPNRLLQMLRDMDVTQPLWIQGYVWDVIWRGLDLVAITPQGRSMSYIPPLIANLMDSQSYTYLPAGKWPILTILCGSIERAQSVYHTVNLFTKGLSAINSICVYGGGAEAMQEVNLLNGCSILVATPDCLLRLKSRKIVYFTHLCHLVLDGEDLVEDFAPQVDELIAEFRGVQDCDDRFNQLVLIAKKYSPSMELFIARHMPDPYVVIGDKLEAAVFGNIKQEVRLVDDRVSYLCELLSNSVTAHQRVVVTTSDMTTASHVKQMLTSCMSKCIFILDEDNISDLTTIVQAFTTTQADQPILVCTDGVLDKIRLTCADVVIHYDLPKKHCNFANRLWCMREKFNTKVNLDQNLQVSSCYSHILLTKADSSMAPNLVIHLERTKSEIPADVKAMAQQEIKQRELCKSTPLCVNLKMFGYCRTQFYCSQRHLICKDLDRSNKGSIYMNLPTQGHIQVLVLHVVNASRYYVRLIQHTDTHGTDVSHSYAALAMRMATLTDRYKIFTPVHGEMYAIKDNYGVFHRVVCIDLEEPDYVGTVAHVKVQRIDIGNEMVVRTSELCRLPLELKNIPRQAVEVISCRIQPYDNDVVWTLKATQKVVEELQGKTMTGSIVLSLGNTLWLDPLVKKEILHGIKERIISFNVRQDLIRQKLAIRNPQHLDLLYAVCEGVIDVPTYRSANIVLNSHNVPVPLCVQNLGDVSLDSQSSYQPIIVSAVHDEGVVFVQLLNMQDRLQKFQAEMQSVMLVTDLETKNIRLGSLVAARYPDGDPTEDITITEDDYINPKGHLEKNDWFRAKVLSCHNDNTYTVLFLDYGDNAHIHARDIAVLPTYLAHFPCQAVECKLYHVDYSNLTDPISAADVLFDLTTPGDEEIEDKKLLAKVHSIEPAVHVGTDCHLVSIMDTNNTYDVDIAQYMVLLGHYSLCPKYLDKVFDCGDSNLVSLVEECRLLYSASTPKQDELLSIAESISHQIVADFHVADADTKAHLSRIVVHLISWLPHTAVVKHILHNLHSVVDIEDMALLMNMICYYLDKTQYSSLHESLLPYLNTLASHRQHASSLLSIGAVRILTKLTDVADRRMKDNYLYTIDGILQHYDDSFVERLLSSECVSMFCEFLLLNSDDDLTLQSLQTLAHILHSERIQVSFRKLDGIKYLVKLLEFNKNAEIQKQCLHLTQSLICGNKDLFKSLNAVDVIQGLLSQFAIDTEIFTICTQIIASLRTTVQKVMQIEKQTDSTPEPQKILHKRLQLRDGPVKRMTPRTCWTQDRYNVLISVDIPDLEISRDMICDFLQDKLVFRCKVDNIEYHLQLELYELLDTSECKSYEHINHKYFGLRKLKHFRWPRLTKDKKKMYNVMVDISRISLNSDSSDCDEDQTIPDSLSLVKKYNTSGSITDALCSTRGGVSAHEPPVLQSSTSTDNSTEEDSDEFWDDESLERRNNDQY